MNNRVKITFEDLILILEESIKQRCSIHVDVDLVLTFTYDITLKQLRFNYDWDNEISMTNVENIYIWDNNDIITIHSGEETLHLEIYKFRITTKEYLNTLQFLKQT